jgi:hypothetical protein
MPTSSLGFDIDAALPLLVGVLVLGFRHGFDWDHIAAITDITSTTVASNAIAGTSGSASSMPSRAGPRWMPPRRALALGTMYALGHASVVAMLGLAALLLGAVLPVWVDPLLGRVVGLTLVVLGAWLLASAARYARSGEEFRLRSRWMLVFDGLRLTRDRIRRRPPATHETRESRSYGAGTSYGIGVIHGIGAETATQVLLIAALGGAAGRGLGVPLMMAFIIGLVLANTVIVGISASGFAGLGRRRRLNIAFGVVVGTISIVIGVLFVVGWEAGLPDMTELLGGATLD